MCTKAPSQKRQAANTTINTTLFPSFRAQHAAHIEKKPQSSGKETGMARYNNILDTVGNTPLVKLNNMAPDGVNIYVKVESFNPTGSVKDRMAKAIIEQAEASGELQPGQTVIEATSGNTGIALAMVCAQKGYPLVICMAENFSVERRKLLRFLGAKTVLTPAAEKGTGMLNKASELADAHGYFLCRQFENEANADVHSQTTAWEIIEDMNGERIDYWIAGFGTGGTLKGVARTLKGFDKNIQIMAAEPDNCPVLSSGLPQPRDLRGQPTGSHPHFRPHLMQGSSPDFISALTESAQANGWIDQVVPIAGDDAMAMSRKLACEEGILVGITSGATLAGAMKLAETASEGSNIICMLADTGERYLSTPLFDHIDEDMNEAEMEISESTPSARFVQTAAAVTALPEQVDAKAGSFVQATIAANGVTMFALEWCEFCWSARKMFAQLGIPYKSVDLDSVAFQEDDLGVKCRGVLHRMTGSPTIPQIYIDGELIGGCTELFDLYSSGELQQKLSAAGVSFDTDATVEPTALLPKWVHPRKRAA
jgi:cysteine synthase A